MKRDVVGKICAVCGRNRDDKCFITVFRGGWQGCGSTRAAQFARSAFRDRGYDSRARETCGGLTRRACSQDMSDYPAHLRDCPLCIDCNQRTEGGCCPPTPIPQRLQEYKNMLAAGHDPTFKFGDG